MTSLESRSPDTPSVHHEHCDAVLTASDLVAGITNKPCNCDAVGARQLPDTPDVSEAERSSFSTHNDDPGEILARANKHLRDLCEGDARWTMRIPARPRDDSDLIFGAVIRLAEQQLSALSQSTTDTQRLDAARWKTVEGLLYLDGEVDLATGADVLTYLGIRYRPIASHPQTVVEAVDAIEAAASLDSPEGANG